MDSQASSYVYTEGCTPHLRSLLVLRLDIVGMAGLGSSIPQVSFQNYFSLSWLLSPQCFRYLTVSLLQGSSIEVCNFQGILCPVSWGCKIHWLHLCRGVRLSQRVSCGPVGWGCRIHWLHLCRGVRLSQQVSWIWY